MTTIKKHLWSKDTGTMNVAGENQDKVIQFTAGKDAELDKHIAYYDAVASAVHAKALNAIGIYNSKELRLVLKSLKKIAKSAVTGRFAVPKGMEDCHTAIESMISQEDMAGAAGQKIHTGRSRNDQIGVAMRLYLKNELFKTGKLCSEIAKKLASMAQKYKYNPMPGYSHTKKAMVSTVGLWLGSHAESFLDDAKGVMTYIAHIDKSVLGSASGFGTAANTNREQMAKQMGFKGIHKNSLYCQSTRLKAESGALQVLQGIMVDAAKVASDIIFYGSEGIGYVSIEQEFTTGSSLMPNKQNPDVFELIRAKSHSVLGHSVAISSMQLGLVSGYNRDAQQSKEHVLNAFSETIQSLEALLLGLEHLKINLNACMTACTADLKATDDAIDKALKGKAFRKAYANADLSEEDGFSQLDESKLNNLVLSRKSSGATGNPCIPSKEAVKVYNTIVKKLKKFEAQMKKALEDEE